MLVGCCVEAKDILLVKSKAEAGYEEQSCCCFCCTEEAFGVPSVWCDRNCYLNSVNQNQPESAANKSVRGRDLQPQQFIFCYHNIY